MAPAELGESAYVFVSVHRGADLAEREGGGGSFLRLERQQHQHECQERVIQRECRQWVVRSETNDLHTTEPLNTFTFSQQMMLLVTQAHAFMLLSLFVQNTVTPSCLYSHHIRT